MTTPRPADDRPLPEGAEARGSFAVPLRCAAHGRTGDKGNRSNISLVAWHPALYPLLAEQITAEVVARQFAARAPARVLRYLLPQLHAMNFVLDEALDGGVNDSLNLDSHGKALSFHLLALPLAVPAALWQHLKNPPTSPGDPA